MKKSEGFTLVELAIVITIIGLLIGGVLKGQELLENARLTSAATQLKSYASAAITFKDIYKALPGDLKDPSGFIQNCIATPCSDTGDANGVIGSVNNWDTSVENTNFWLHLAKANLISGVDPGRTGLLFAVTSPQPSFPMGGRMGVIYFDSASYIRQGTAGQYWHGFTRGSSDAQALPAIPHNKNAKFDLKADDGKPRTGSVILYGYDALTGDNYDPNATNLTYFLVKTDF